jgi:thymidylate synthase (FAD)
MKVKVVGVTQPTIEGVDSAGDLVAYAARVSNPNNQLNKETAPRLLKYLAKHKHWSPFEMVSVTMEITTTRDIARQILRHRSFSFQEFSQRYAVAQNFDVREARMQDETNRQNSIPVVSPQDSIINIKWKRKQKELNVTTQKLYEWALVNGIAKEQARAILPEGNTESVLYMAGTLRSWIHYCELRMANGTQKEHMDIASECWEHIVTLFPDLSQILD